jgi:hypothetical protein
MVYAAESSHRGWRQRVRWLLDYRGRVEIMPTPSKWLRYLLGIVLGNGLYFSLAPHFPLLAQHKPYHVDLGLLIDFWLCLLVYGMLESAAFLHRRFRSGR